MPVLLGIDYGSKRIGLAVGNTDQAIATPLSVVDAGASLDDSVRAVQSAAEEYGVHEFVLGLPLNMDGTEGPQAGVIRSFGKRLKRRLQKDVHYWDERLTSRAADELLSPANLTNKKRKARQDAVAAQLILQTYLDARKQSQSEP